MCANVYVYIYIYIYIFIFIHTHIILHETTIHSMYPLVCKTTRRLTLDVQVVLDADEVLERTLGLQKTVQAERGPGISLAQLAKQDGKMWKVWPNPTVNHPSK